MRFHKTLGARLKIAILLLFFLWPFASTAEEPPSEPILCIESGMHTAGIRQIATDALNRYLVTASYDKTVGVWDASTGKLIRKLRPPIEEGNTGQVFAVAISPDGSTIAAGGWTGKWEWETSDALKVVDFVLPFNLNRSVTVVYIFDRSTGRLTGKITGIPNVTHNLAFSKDGRFLLVSVGVDNGIRLYRTSDYSLTGKDTDYGFDSYGADFDLNGRLITSSVDGYIRLYETEGGTLKLIAKTKGRGGKEPYDVSFLPSPPGNSKVAVMFGDSNAVDVLSGNNLDYLYSPDTLVLDNESISSITWSADGKFLYASGKSRTGKYHILKWPYQASGQLGIPVEIDGASSSIRQMLPLTNGGVAFRTSGPGFGIINANDEKTLYVGPDNADFSNIGNAFRVSDDGLTVQFGYEKDGQSPATFSIKERLLTTDIKGQITDLKPPITRLPDLVVTWEGSIPKLNDKSLRLEPRETSYSYALPPSGDGFLLGTGWYLRLFDIPKWHHWLAETKLKSGAEKWKVPANSIVWSVNVSGNGKLAVAAFGNGTIRWYRMDTRGGTARIFSAQRQKAMGNVDPRRIFRRLRRWCGTYRISYQSRQR